MDTWEDPFDLLPQIDACILGGGMYPGYEQYWSAILANPDGILAFTGKTATKGEIEYAHFEGYDVPGIKTVSGIAEIEGNYPSKGVGERGAWFRDSEGNLLGIGQPVRR